VSRPGPLRAKEQALDLMDVTPGSLRAQAGVTQDGRVLLGRLTAQVHPPRRTMFADGDGGLVGPLLGPAV